MSALRSRGRRLRRFLNRYGATAFMYATREGLAVIEFAAAERHIRFSLPLPRRDDPQFQRTPQKGLRRTQDKAYEAWEQACRQRWRALALAIKAKLEAVECGISEFEQEFLAFIVDPASRQTMGEILRPQIADRYAGLPHVLLGLPAPQED